MFPPEGISSTDGHDLDWLAFRYVTEELSPAEMTAFEVQLAEDQAAREAVAAAVLLIQTVEAVEGSLDEVAAETVAAPAGSGRKLALNHSATSARVGVADQGEASRTLPSHREGRTGRGRPLHRTASALAVAVLLLVGVLAIERSHRPGEFDRHGGQWATDADSETSARARQLASLWIDAEWDVDHDEAPPVAHVSSRRHSSDDLADELPGGDYAEVDIVDRLDAEVTVPDWLLAALSGGREDRLPNSGVPGPHDDPPQEN